MLMQEVDVSFLQLLFTLVTASGDLLTQQLILPLFNIEIQINLIHFDW